MPNTGTGCLPYIRFPWYRTVSCGVHHPCLLLLRPLLISQSLRISVFFPSVGLLGESFIPKRVRSGQQSCNFIESIPCYPFSFVLFLFPSLSRFCLSCLSVSFLFLRRVSPFFFISRSAIMWMMTTAESPGGQVRYYGQSVDQSINRVLGITSSTTLSVGSTAQCR